MSESRRTKRYAPSRKKNRDFSHAHILHTIENKCMYYIRFDKLRLCVRPIFLLCERVSCFTYIPFVRSFVRSSLRTLVSGGVFDIRMCGVSHVMFSAWKASCFVSIAILLIVFLRFTHNLIRIHSLEFQLCRLLCLAILYTYLILQYPK